MTALNSGWLTNLDKNETENVHWQTEWDVGQIGHTLLDKKTYKYNKNDNYNKIQVLDDTSVRYNQQKKSRQAIEIKSEQVEQILKKNRKSLS